MWGDMALSAGLSLLKAGMSYSAAADKAKSDRAWQQYNNTMTNIAGGQANNAITTNQMMARERSIEQGFQIRKSEYVTLASAEVSAAASGTTGRSVQATLFGIERNAADADAKRVNDWENQEAGFDVQRSNIAMQVAMKQDLRVIPEPSLATHMLGFVDDVGKLYKNNPDEFKRGIDFIGKSFG